MIGIARDWAMTCLSGSALPRSRFQVRPASVPGKGVDFDYFWTATRSESLPPQVVAIFDWRSRHLRNNRFIYRPLLTI
jgi:hypothetical protein